MSQYNIDRNEYAERNNNLFEVGMQADETGALINKRYNKDAWGRPKVYSDHSLFSATWTHSIPGRVWEEEAVTRAGEVITITPQQTFNKATSTEGLLSLKSGTVQNDGNALRSKTFPRYQANKGQLYSTAVSCPNATDNGYSQWGLATTKDGVFFRQVGDGTDWDLFVGRRRDGVEVDLISVKAKILELFPTFDPTKGHVYDIQFQYRGVGDFYFFIDLELVHTIELMGTLDYLSLNDAAMGVTFSCYTFENGTEIEMRVGCVDISSEGGAPERTIFGSINTGPTLLTLGGSNTDTAVLAMRVPKFITYNSETVFNSRGAILDKLVTWTRDESLTRAYIFRDYFATNLDGLTWTDVPDSFLEYTTGGDGSALQTAFLADLAQGQEVVNEWADIDVKNIITNPATNSEFQLTPDDIIVVTVRSTGAANVKSSAVLYYSEQI